MNIQEQEIYWAEVNWMKKYHPELRQGQIAMNALREVRPDLYEKVTGTEFDPFYLDSRLDSFINYIYDL